MGRRILAGIVAPPAIVAEVGQVLEILGGKGPSQLHGRKNGAEPLAIPAGVADGHDPINLF
jgi:hypothetical protein